MRHFTYNPFPIEDDLTMLIGGLRYQVKYGRESVIQSNRRLRAGALSEDEKSAPVVQMTPIEIESFLCFYSGGKRPLKVVQADDVLLINAHGSNKALAIGCEVSRNGHEFYLCLTPQQLGEMLEEDGLRRRHRLIKMVSCFSAASLKEGASDNFSKALAEELGARGYEDIIVGGYLHATHLTDKDWGALPVGGLSEAKNVSDLTDEQKDLLRTSRHELTVGSGFMPAHGTRLYFDARGEAVSQERVNALKRA